MWRLATSSKLLLSLAHRQSSANIPLLSDASPGDVLRPIVPVEALTNCEIDVLILLAQRLSDKEIAERLVISPGTIKKHTAHIYRKLGVDNGAAAAQARRLGLL